MSDSGFVSIDAIDRTEVTRRNAEPVLEPPKGETARAHALSTVTDRGSDLVMPARPTVPEKAPAPKHTETIVPVPHNSVTADQDKPERPSTTVLAPPKVSQSLTPSPTRERAPNPEPPRVHIGTVEVRLAEPKRPARRSNASKAKGSLARGLFHHFGIRQG